MESVPLPKTISISEAKANRAVFTIEPLFPGYGMTVGNALRRVLLSSLPGAAITSVKFEGASHEFSTLPYVKEDVVDIILNLKLVRLRLFGDEDVKVMLKASGSKTVTAGDIVSTSDVEVVNPKQVIATLTDDAAKFELELTVGRGRGYVPVENREKEKLDIGTIAIDAIYTPMKNVNFTTEHVRVEQITNYDKLIIDITTDGSITPVDAMQQAAGIMVDHFKYVAEAVTASDAGEATVAAETVETETVTEESSEDKPKKRGRKKKTDDANDKDEKTDQE